MGITDNVADPTVTDGQQYISKRSPKVIGLEVSNMATTLDTHVAQNDDLHLMGLSELDSHLSMFDPGARGSSTPGAMSNSAYGESISTSDNPSTTIFVESPEDGFPSKSQSETLFAGVGGPKSFARNIIQYVSIALSSRD